VPEKGATLNANEQPRSVTVEDFDYPAPAVDALSYNEALADVSDDHAVSDPIEPEAESGKKFEPDSDTGSGGFRLDRATWPQSFSSLGLTGILENVASHCQCVSVTADGAEFVLCSENASLFNTSHVEKLTAALAQAEGIRRTVTIKIGNVEQTPAKWIAERRALALEEAKHRMQTDEVVIALCQNFDGELLVDSIKPGGTRV
jgi:DNA polymerase-3 subunit gamma/tau